MKQRIREERLARFPRGESSDDGVTIRTLLAKLSARKSDPRLKGIRGVYQVEVEGVGSWYVRVQGETLEVSQSPAPVDCAIIFSPEDFIDIACGRQNPMTAFLQGRVSGWGDVGMALALRRLLPLSP